MANIIIIIINFLYDLFICFIIIYRWLIFNFSEFKIFDRFKYFF